MVLCGISTCFQVLSPCMGQIVHALLTRPPLEHNLPFRRTSSYLLARLACVKHAASVRPEPGSNSYVQSFSHLRLPPESARQSQSLSQPSMSVSLSQNLTVFLYNDFSLYRFQGSPLSFLATTLRIIPAFPCLVNTFQRELTFFTVLSESGAKPAEFGGFPARFRRFRG